MPSFHDILIQLRDGYGFAGGETARGLCAFYAEKGIDAFLVGEYQTTFKKRYRYIKSHYTAWPSLFHKAKEASRSLSQQPGTALLKDKDFDKIFDVAAFLEQGELYQNPSNYSDVFGQSLTQLRAQEISVYAQSEGLEKCGGRVCLASFFGIYSPEELLDYVALMNNFAKTGASDFALSLLNDRHRIALCYSHAKQGWWIININEPLLPIVSAPIDDNFDSDLASELYLAFYVPPPPIEHCGFVTHLYTTGSQQQSMQVHVDQLMASDRFNLLHRITPIRANQIDANGATLALLASMMDDSVVCKEIVKIGALESFNQPTKQYGATPILMAAKNGHAATVQALVEAKTLEGEFVVDLNHASEDGVTAAHFAAREGYTTILKILVDAKTWDGKAAANFNMADKNGQTPIFLAAYGGHAEALQVLVDAKTSDGKAAVNVNVSSTKSGSTPLLIAASKGHLDALRVLIGVKMPDGKTATDLNQPNKGGFSPLQLAAFNGHYGIVSLLIKAGADIGHLCDGFSAQDFAELNKHHTIVELLDEYSLATQHQASPS